MVEWRISEGLTDYDTGVSVMEARADAIAQDNVVHMNISYPGTLIMLHHGFTCRIQAFGVTVAF